MGKGKIISVEDRGSVWQIFYEDRGRVGSVTFDWRQFAHFYEGVSGRSFYHDYRFGDGIEIIRDYFKGKIIEIEGEGFDKRVRLEGF